MRARNDKEIRVSEQWQRTMDGQREWEIREGLNANVKMDEIFAHAFSDHNKLLKIWEATIV